MFLHHPSTSKESERSRVTLDRCSPSMQKLLSSADDDSNKMQLTTFLLKFSPASMFTDNAGRNGGSCCINPLSESNEVVNLYHQSFSICYKTGCTCHPGRFSASWCDSSITQTRDANKCICHKGLVGGWTCDERSSAAQCSLSILDQCNETQQNR